MRKTVKVNGRARQQAGFSLIELTVVIGVLGAILIASTTVLTNSFKAKNRVQVADIMESDGSQVIRNLRQMILEAKDIGMTCVFDPAGIGVSVVVVNKFDNGVTRLRCYENDRIASESANGNFSLTSSEVVVSGCNDFVRCDTLPSSSVTQVTSAHFNFNLKVGNTSTPEGGVSRNFKVDVGPRY